MQKTKYFACIYHAALFYSSKRCKIKFNTLFDFENQQQKRITKYFKDIDYSDFVRIYKECTRKPYSFLTIDTTLPASDPLRFRKNLLPIYKNDSN